MGLEGFEGTGRTEGHRRGSSPLAPTLRTFRLRESHPLSFPSYGRGTSVVGLMSETSPPRDGR